MAMILLDHTGTPMNGANGTHERAWNSAATYSFLHTFGLNSSSTLISPYEQNPWVYAAIKAKTNALFSAPFVVNTGTVRKPRPVDDVHPWQKFFDRPSRMMPRSQVWLSTVLGMDCFNESYWLLIGKTGWRLPNEVPVECYPIFGCNVQMMDEKGDIITDPMKRVSKYMFYGTTNTSDSSIRLDAHQVVRFSNLNPRDSLKGFSTITSASTALSGAHNAENWNSAFFGNSCDPGGWLINPGRLSEDVYQQTKRRWNEEHQGALKRGRTAILESGTTFTPNPRTQKDMEFLSYLAWVRDEILAVLGVQKSVLSITDDLNYATHEGQVRVFYENTIIPLMRDLEDTLWTQLFSITDNGNFFGTFDVSKVAALNSDLSQKLSQAQSLMALGYEQNEINERLNLGMKPSFAFDVTETESKPDVVSSTPTVGTDEVAVQDTALNGAQISSLVDIVAQVAAGVLPASSAIELVLVSFPTIDKQTAEAIINPASKQTATNEETEKPLIESTPEKSAIPALRWCRSQGEILEGKFWTRAAINTLQKRLTAKLQKYFKTLRKDQADRLAQWIEDKGYDEDFVVEQLTKEDLNRILFARERWDKFLKDEAEKPMKDIITASAKAVAKEIGGSYAPPNPLLLEVQGRVLGSLVVVNKDTRKQIRSTLIQSVAEGETISEMRDRITKNIPTIGGHGRALRIATTETGFAQSTVRYESMKDAGAERHQWVTTGRNTRPSHSALEGEVREIGKKFSNGLLHPHELGAPADEVVNCHCESVVVFDI